MNLQSRILIRMVDDASEICKILLFGKFHNGLDIRTILNFFKKKSIRNHGEVHTRVDGTNFELQIEICLQLFLMYLIMLKMCLKLSKY